ncbi:MAG: DNA primase [Bacteroidales bacterium]|jgi:DNA primase|nr:DNA primase [Bacteroidales bacterium]MBQ6101027.1 DNA primase [Bacteroidales bacterium]
MPIPRETVDQILQAARIEEVVGEFVSLKKRGSNMWGNCPFHNEKTPSFSVNPARNIFKCFGCGKAGDSAKFLMEHEHYTYPEALRYLAKKYNIQIEEKELSPEERMAQTEREKMFNINAFADKFFVDTLWNTDEGKSIGLEYFRERGYLNPIIEKFHLGYSPSKWEAFTNYAKQNGYDPEFLEKVGFSIKRQNGEYYDRYHGRVMFPIHNLTGKVIGFGGRILQSDPEKKLAKYQNSPESEIYQKKETLYGIYFAKSAIVNKDECILVEGYFDVLRMHQIGIENVVASSGTSLTTEQIRLVKRYTKNITMLYDGDAAGVHAALRGTDMILAEGMNVRVVVLPPEHDPDTFGKEYPTEEVLRYLKDNAKDFIRFKTELLLKDAANDPIKKGQVVRNMVETISVVPDPIFRIAYVKETSRLLDMPEETLMMELNKMLRAKFKKSLGVEGEVIPDEPIVTSPTQEQPQEETLPPGYYQERELVKLMLLYGGRTLTIKQQDELGQEIEEQVPVAQMIVDDLINDNIEFNDPVNRKIFEIYDQALNTEELPNDQFFTSNEDEQVSQVAIDLVTTQYKLDGWERHGIFVKKEEDILRKAVQYAILRYKDQIIDARRKEIQDQIKEEPDPDNQLILLKKKKHWDDLRVQINKMLGIVIAK